MPRLRQHIAPQITVAVVRRYYQQLSTGSPYYVYEEGRNAIKGCALRVHRKKVEIGVRSTRGAWHPVADLHRDIDIETLEGYRTSCRKQSRELQHEKEEPSLAHGRTMTLTQLWKDHRNYLVGRRSARRSPRTIEHRDYLWNKHLLPLYGDLTLRQFTDLPSATLSRIPEAIRERVNASCPWAEGPSCCQPWAKLPANEL